MVTGIFSHNYFLNINDGDEIIKVIESCNPFFENKLNLKTCKYILFQNIVEN